MTKYDYNKIGFRFAGVADLIAAEAKCHNSIMGYVLYK